MRQPPYPAPLMRSNHMNKCREKVHTKVIQFARDTELCLLRRAIAECGDELKVSMDGFYTHRNRHNTLDFFDVRTQKTS